MATEVDRKPKDDGAPAFPTGGNGDFYHLGWYLNRYAQWYRIEHFAEPIDVVRWLVEHGKDIDGPIDFLVSDAERAQ